MIKVPHLHVSVFSILLELLELLIVLIPLKIVAAYYMGRYALADAVVSVL